MILDYLWQYPAYVNLLNIIDLVSVSYPPVSLIPRSMVLCPTVLALLAAQRKTLPFMVLSDFTHFVFFVGIHICFAETKDH
jgi:hypothetical protein